MAKWAFLTALQSVRGGAAVPRCVGADGRPLARPWRQRPDLAVLAARRVRAQRSQPLWPRLVGVLCLSVAIVAAFDPVGPVPRNVAASPSVGPGASLQGLAAVFPTGTLAALPAYFEWRSPAPGVTSRLVVVDAGYEPIAAIDGIAETRWTPPVGLLERLAAGGTFHWYVVGEVHGATVKSPLETFAIR